MRIERIELGCAGHLCVGNSCHWSRHTRVGKYRVSTVGDYFPRDAVERETIGGDFFFETMAFELGEGEEEASEGCGCGVPLSFEELDSDRYMTAGEAQTGHEAIVEKYLNMQGGGWS